MISELFLGSIIYFCSMVPHSGSKGRRFSLFCVSVVSFYSCNLVPFVISARGEYSGLWLLQSSFADVVLFSKLAPDPALILCVADQDSSR